MDIAPMTDLPQGWTLTALGEIGDINPRHPSNLSDGMLVSFASMPALSTDRPEFESLQERPFGEVRKGFTHFAEGDVLFAKITPCMENGKGAVAVDLRNGLGCGTTEIHVVRPLGRIVPHYIYHYLHQPSIRRQAEANFTGSAGQARVPVSFIKDLEIPIPPLAEQQRIVAKLEVLLGKVDACRKRLEKIPVILKRFRQSALAAACSGRLTADWREENPVVESAEMLIDRISRERRRRHDTLRCTHGTGRKKALADYDNFDPALRGDLELPDLPETWRWVDLRFLMSPEEAFCYGVVQPGEDDHGGPRLVRICDLGGGLVRISDLRGITAKVHGQYERSVISGGEVLISVVGTIGRAAIAPTELKGANIARAVAKIPIREFEARYFLLWLSTSRAETWMVGDAREVARKTLNLEQLRTLPAPLPPIPEQQEIVRRVDALFALADQIETRYAKAKTHVDRLTQSILAKAFRGDLVPQDPNDEPASVLLERIHLQRQGAGVARRQPRRKGVMAAGKAVIQ